MRGLVCRKEKGESANRTGDQITGQKMINQWMGENDD